MRVTGVKRRQATGGVEQTSRGLCATSQQGHLLLLHQFPRFLGLDGPLEDVWKPRDEPKSHGPVEPVRVKAIELVEDVRIKERLDCYWIGKVRNFEVIQNAWGIIKDNGLEDCNTKYLGGISFLFEWDSKSIARESMESNILWLGQWFDELKPSVGRLVWVNFEGVPSRTADRDNSFSNDSQELDTEEGEFVEVHSCNDDLPMGPNMDPLVHDHCNSEKALG
ncbi:hypothetical protein Tco_0874027 [Tanacetum coccineum]|uniref:DUF4283 domain-containing protein n=1 Tax=Tanacetum coccineum TaxID=301880 RepID=A0ABQ5BKI2_9ASTR